MINRLLTASAFLMSFSAFASGNPGITLGQPVTGGTGCPAGSAAAALSPDATSLSIIFDNYTVQAGGTTGRSIDRKTCDVVVPVHVPQGFSVSIMQVDYRGFNNLPYGAQSQFNVEYFFAGSNGPGFIRSFDGPLSQDFELSNQLKATSMVWSACGADVNLRTNTSMLVRAQAYGPDAMASVDSADIQSSVVYQLQWKQCGGEYPPIPGQGGGLTDPNPGDYQGNCKIDSHYANGVTTYFVRDINLNLIARTTNYEQAIQIAEQADATGQCMGGVTQSPPPGYPVPAGPYPTPAPYPAPAPYPVPAPYPQPVSPYPVLYTCTLNGMYGQYSGQGYSQPQAVASARDNCLRAENNARVCNSYPVRCF